jgi:hypothetical protein
MLRGCQKKIVFIKNTGSKLFDEAYFVISGREDAPALTDGAMVDEAKRIIENATLGDRGIGLFSPKNLKILGIFSIGAVVSGLITSLIFILAG